MARNLSIANYQAMWPGSPWIVGEGRPGPTLFNNFLIQATALKPEQTKMNCRCEVLERSSPCCVEVCWSSNAKVASEYLLFPTAQGRLCGDSSLLALCSLHKGHSLHCQISCRSCVICIRLGVKANN